MSLNKPKIPEAPAPAPETPSIEPAKQELGGDNPNTAKEKAKRQGRKGLRIPLNVGGSGLGASGVNVPR